ncbi:NUDIX domain-containing protein (plasmid) [Streptomyces viridifaciens]|nr:NUDIX domain-containing protein [Streptomyces viridifaciens]
MPGRPRILSRGRGTGARPPLRPDDVLPGLWDYPAGGLEQGKDPRAGAIRELVEETGIHRTDIESNAARRQGFGHRHNLAPHPDPSASLPVDSPGAAATRTRHSPQAGPGA